MLTDKHPIGWLVIRLPYALSSSRRDPTPSMSLTVKAPGATGFATSRGVRRDESVTDSSSDKRRRYAIRQIRQVRFMHDDV